MSEFRNEGPGVYLDSDGGTCTVYRVTRCGRGLVGIRDADDRPDTWRVSDGLSGLSTVLRLHLIRRIGPLTLPKQIEDKPKSLQLEAGERYVMRNGKVTGVLFTRRAEYPFSDGNESWQPDGIWLPSLTPHPRDIIREATPAEIAEADGVVAPTEPVYGWQGWDKTFSVWCLGVGMSIHPERVVYWPTEAQAEDAAMRNLKPGDVFRTFRILPGQARRVEASTSKKAVPCEEPCPTPVTFSTGASQ